MKKFSLALLALLAIPAFLIGHVDAGLLGKGCAPPGGSSSGGGSGAPAAAQAVGYNTLTANSTLISPTNGNWYYYDFEGTTVIPGSAVQNGDGSIGLIAGQSNQHPISSAHTASTPYGFAGTAYGGGFYWEVTGTMTNPQTSPATPAALWMVDVEHQSQGSRWINNWPDINSTFWPSSPQIQNQDHSSSYDDYTEIDIFEYDFTTAQGHPAGYEINDSNWNNHLNDAYGSGALNWGQSNHWHQAANGASGSTPVPSNTDFTQSHKYAVLWVPATGSGQTTTTQGYVRIYFDGVQIAGGLPTDPVNPYDGYSRPMYWNYHDPTDYTHYPTPTAAGAPTQHNQGFNGSGQPYPTYGDVDMSIMDWRHQLLLMNAGQYQGMTITSSKVWQASAANNIVQ